METCGACGGELMELGKLGNRVHARCRNCGLESSMEEPEETTKAVWDAVEGTYKRVKVESNEVILARLVRNGKRKLKAGKKPTTPELNAIRRAEMEKRKATA